MAGEAYQSTTAFTDYDAKYRYYNPTTMRWLNRDPLGMVDGPNVYAYVRGNVVNAVDLDGLSWLSAGKVCNRNCTENQIKDVYILPEENWSGNNPNWVDHPGIGECVDSDGIYSSIGVLKIPDTWTCYMVCSEDDCPKRQLHCESTFLMGLLHFIPGYRPRPPVVGDGGDGFPPNPLGPDSGLINY